MCSALISVVRLLPKFLSQGALPLTGWVCAHACFIVELLRQAPEIRC
jgi:hypothetical protein